MTILTRPLCVACVTVLLCGTVNAEVVGWTYKSPDAKWAVQVDRVSEAPDFTVTVKQGDKPVWSYHPDPRDKSVHIFWRPDSTAFLMEHVTRQKEYRLCLINVAGPHLKVFPISFESNLNPASIVDGTVKWDVRDGQGLIIKLTIEDLDSKKRELQINQDSRLLESKQNK
jgi:hypothetical protein